MYYKPIKHNGWEGVAIAQYNEADTMAYRIIIFLLFNFGALGIAGHFTGIGVPSDWYVTLNKAPWTPPGWVFGAAWSTIMVCFSVYMAKAWRVVAKPRQLGKVYLAQWLLNVAWSPLFFYYHYMLAGLIVLVLLTLLMGYMIGYYRTTLRYYSWLLGPYFAWLIVACSLNGYAFFYN